jgi:hypothetical protein
VCRPGALTLPTFGAKVELIAASFLGSARTNTVNGEVARPNSLSKLKTL